MTGARSSVVEADEIAMGPLTAEYLPYATAEAVVRPLYEAHPMASVFDMPVWVDVLIEGFGYRMGWIVWKRAGEIVGCLPVGWSLKLWKRRALSLPFTTWANPNWIEGEMPDEAWTLAYDELRREGASTWIVKGEVPGGSSIAGRYVESVIDLQRPLEDVRATYKKRVRASINKARRENVEIKKWRPEDAGLVARMLERNRQSKGMPAFPREYFTAVERHMIQPGLAECWLAWHEGRPVAFNLDAPGKTWHMMIGATIDDVQARRLRANNLLQDVVIEAAHAGGSTHVSFGLSQVELDGLRSFKRGYGAVEIATAYTQFPAMEIPEFDGRQPAATRWLQQCISRVPERLYYPLTHPFIRLWEW